MREGMNEWDMKFNLVRAGDKKRTGDALTIGEVRKVDFLWGILGSLPYYLTTCLPT